MEAFLGNLEFWLADLGGWGYVVAPLVMATVAVLPIPAEAPAMANGMLFGAGVGSVLTWIGAMLGAAVSYEIARGAGRPVARRFVGVQTVARIDAGVQRAGWWGLLGLRLVPVVAFTALNWGAGLCGVPRWRFLWTTGLGIVPGVVLFTTSGVGLSALWRRSPSLAGAAVLGFLAVMVVVALRRRRAEAVGEPG
jgi:uncharacterized membrane protein YdjX (TVP38/TMEM64 family)